MALSKDEEEASAESTVISSNEHEVLVAIRRDQDEARIEYEKEQALLIQAEVERNAASTNEQQRLSQRKMCRKFGIIIGGVLLILIVVISIALAVSGKKSSNVESKVPLLLKTFVSLYW